MKIINDKIKTVDNFELDVEVRIPDKNIGKTVIMSHGLAENKDGSQKRLFKIANALCDNGYKVISYDFRGHGKSSGSNLDVNPSSLEIDLKTIIDNYESDEYYLFGFSIGAFTICKYLSDNNDKKVKKIVLIGPPLDPINGLFFNPKELSKTSNKEFNMSNLKTKGYIYWTRNDFKISKKFLDEFFKFDSNNSLKALSGRTLILQGINDKIVNKKYNEEYSKEYNLKYKEYDASHSLFEKIDDVINEIIEFYKD